MTQKVSYQQIFNFIKNANHYFKEKDGKTKQCYAIEKMEGVLKDSHSKWLNVVNDFKIDFAKVNEIEGHVENGCLLVRSVNEKTGEKEYFYTPVNQKALDKAIDEAFAAKTIEIEPYYSPSPEAEKEIKEMHHSFVECFTPFIIEAEKELKKVG